MLDGDEFIVKVKPYIKEYSDIELAKIANIEQRLRNILKENSQKGFPQKGIKEEEARYLLEWVIQQDRQMLMRCYCVEDLEDLDLQGECRVSQTIVYKLLTNMRLNPRCSTISNILKNYYGEDHKFNSVTIPIINKNQEVEEKDFLIDATYIQFFKKDEVSVFGKSRRYSSTCCRILVYKSPWRERIC